MITEPTISDVPIYPRKKNCFHRRSFRFIFWRFGLFLKDKSKSYFLREKIQNIINFPRLAFIKNINENSFEEYLNLIAESLLKNLNYEDLYIKPIGDKAKKNINELVLKLKKYLPNNEVKINEQIILNKQNDIQILTLYLGDVDETTLNEVIKKLNFQRNSVVGFIYFE